MSEMGRKDDDGLLRLFAYGSVISTYVLILIGGYVTTSNSGAACGASPGTESWPFCNGALFPNFSDPAQVIEFSHRIFNFVVAFFIVGTAIHAISDNKRSCPNFLSKFFVKFSCKASSRIGN